MLRILGKGVSGVGYRVSIRVLYCEGSSGVLSGYFKG